MKTSEIPTTATAAKRRGRSPLQAGRRFRRSCHTARTPRPRFETTQCRVVRQSARPSTGVRRSPVESDRGRTGKMPMPSASEAPSPGIRGLPLPTEKHPSTTVRDRPRVADGVSADGIGIGGLSVRESATPTPPPKNVRPVQRAHGPWIREKPDGAGIGWPASRVDAKTPSILTPNSGQGWPPGIARSAPPTGARNPPAGASRASSCAAHCITTGRIPIPGNGREKSPANTGPSHHSIAQNRPGGSPLSTSLSTRCYPNWGRSVIGGFSKKPRSHKAAVALRRNQVGHSRLRLLAIRREGAE